MSESTGSLDDSTPPDSELARARELVEQGANVEARLLLESHLASIDSITEIDTTDMLKSKHLLAYVLRQLGELDLAKDIQTEVVDFIERRFGLDNEMGDAALGNLAVTLCALSEFESAIAVRRQIIQIRRLRLGENDISSLRAISSLADILRTIGNFSEAMVVDSDVLSRASAEGYESRFILDIKRHIVSDLVGQRKWVEAGSIAEELYNAGMSDLDENDELRQHLERDGRKFRWLIKANRRRKLRGR